MTMKTVKNIFYVLLIAILSESLSSCKDNTNPINDSNIPQDVRDVYSIMSFVYLWADQAATQVPLNNLSNYTDPIALVDDMTIEADRFTYIEKGNEIINVLAGTPTDNGITGRFLDDTLYIAHVDPNSPADRAGLRRGHWIKSIGDVVTTPNPGGLTGAIFRGNITVTYIDTEGMANNAVLTPVQYNTPTVVHREVKTVGNTKVGYLVFNTFGQTSSEELDVAFGDFKNRQVNELILDLRYNGGGFTNVARKLGSLITSAPTGEIFLQQIFNEDFTKAAVEQNADFRKDNTLLFSSENNSLDLDRVFILIHNGTASASEAVINGLRPFINVQLIGRNTSGKNVGSVIYRKGEHLQEHTLLPIAFSVANAQGFSDYAAGFEPNFLTIDNVKVPLGDVRENMLFQALYYIENGVFSGDPGRIPSFIHQDVLTENPVYLSKPLLTNHSD